MVTAIHTHVEGRGRYKVDGLYQSEECKTFLELRLSRYNGIDKVSASTLTGNILVCFNSENTHTGIQELIREALKEAKEICLPDKHIPKQDSGIATDEKASFRQLVKNLLFPPEETDQPWHLLDKDSVLAGLETNSKTGLSPEQVLERLKRYGPNTRITTEIGSGNPLGSAQFTTCLSFGSGGRSIDFNRWFYRCRGYCRSCGGKRCYRLFYGEPCRKNDPFFKNPGDADRKGYSQL